MGPPRVPVEADRVEHDCPAVAELGAERREAGAEAAARAGARQVSERLELGERREATLELLDGVRARALLRAERSRGATFAEEPVAHVAEHAHSRGPQRRAGDLAHADAAVD